MEQLFKWFRDIMYLLIPGLIYFADMVIILHNKLDLDFFCILKKYESYSLYIIIVVILISYTLGLTMDLGLRGIYWFIYKTDSRTKFKDRFISNITSDKESGKKYEEMFTNYYRTLILVRNLFSSILFLLIILVFSKIVNAILPICIIILLSLLASGYYLLRDQVKIIEKINPAQKISKTSKDNKKLN